MPKREILKSIKGGLIVSCQTNAPLDKPEFMGLLAHAVISAGAVAIRADGPDNVAAIRHRVAVPIIGIYKQHLPGFETYITPTLESAVEVIEAGADIVAIDGRILSRPSGIQLKQLIRGIHSKSVLVIADISNKEEGLVAAMEGADIIATTLSGYTPYTESLTGPDLNLLEMLSHEIDLPVIAEGRYSTPEDVRAAFERGAFAVVVGKAITEPQYIVKRFVAATPRHYDEERTSRG
jgi:N-acylglucosamine-6-phosphate 2-epimerase